MQITDSLLATVKRIAREHGLQVCAETSPEVAAIAGKGLGTPESLTPDEIRSVCASALNQAADKVDET